jgi:hypothetical protein
MFYSPLKVHAPSSTDPTQSHPFDNHAVASISPRTLRINGAHNLKIILARISARRCADRQ